MTQAAAQWALTQFGAQQMVDASVAVYEGANHAGA